MKLYPNNLKNWNFGRAKTAGLINHKRPHISNIGSLTIDQSRELSRQPKSNSSGRLGIFFLLLPFLTLTSCCFTKVSPGNDLDYCACEEWKTPFVCEALSPLPLTQKWWESYQDPTLNALEEQALENNFDLNIAAARILQARALVGITFSNRLPHIGLGASYTRQEALVTLEDFGLGERDVRIEERQIAFPFDLCYEVDFWGKYRNMEAAARERLLASHYNRDAVCVSLTTDVAYLYFTIRTFDEEILYLHKAVEVRQDYLDINLERLRRGLDTEIDVTRAKLDLALAQSELENTKRLRGQAENALGLLLGYSACSFFLEPGLMPEINVCPPPDMPSTLIARRPDVQQRMHIALSALDEIGVAKAEFFPQFSLTGALGTVSPCFSNLFTWQSRFWALAVNTCQVIFDGGRLCSNLVLRKAEYLETVLAYQKQIVIAFKEVEDALTEIQYRTSQVKAQQQAVLFSEATSLLARSQYDSGLINYLLVADAEKTQLNARRMFIHLNGSLLMASVQLIKALGGGFETI